MEDAAIRSWLLQGEEPWTWDGEAGVKITEIGDDQVLAVTPTHFQGKSSGVTLPEQRLASIVTVRGGKIIRTEVYSSPE